MNNHLKKSVSWAVFVVIVGVDIYMNYQLFHWLRRPLYQINEMLFGPVEMGLKGQPGFVVFFQFFIPVILFFAIALAGHFLCKRFEEKLNK